MNIPEKFELMGDTITVKFVNSLITEDDTVGQASYRMNEIRLQRNSDFTPRTAEQTRKTFLHELIHFILYKMKKPELNKDEDFVDVFANLLLQFEKTTKGELNQKGEE